MLREGGGRPPDASSIFFFPFYAPLFAFQSLLCLLPFRERLEKCILKMTSYRLAYPILFTFLLFVICEGCSPEDIVRGCMIQGGQCFCGMGCSSEFRYKDREECKVELRGASKDPCKPNPCNNSGACLQTTTTFSRYKCRCEGTGFYGPRCQHSCTSVNTRARAYPYECIEI